MCGTEWLRQCAWVRWRGHLPDPRFAQVGDGARHLEDAVVGTGGKALLHHGAFQQSLAVGGELTECANVAGRQLGIAVQLVPGA